MELPVCYTMYTVHISDQPEAQNVLLLLESVVTLSPDRDFWKCQIVGLHIVCGIANWAI